MYPKNIKITEIHSSPIAKYTWVHQRLENEGKEEEPIRDLKGQVI